MTENPLHVRIAVETLPLANRPAWQAICRTLALEGGRGPPMATAARSVWAARKELRRAAREARHRAHPQKPADPDKAVDAMPLPANIYRQPGQGAAIGQDVAMAHYAPTNAYRPPGQA